MIFAICKSTAPSGSSRERNCVCIMKIFLSGVSMAVLRVEMENILRFFPLIHIMKPFMRICFPGAVAILRALACFFATKAFAVAFSFSVNADVFAPADTDMDANSDSTCFSNAATFFIPKGAGLFCSTSNPTSGSFSIKSTDHLLQAIHSTRDGAGIKVQPVSYMEMLRRGPYERNKAQSSSRISGSKEGGSVARSLLTTRALTWHELMVLWST
eukprot:scaffold504749_cov47-Attheya_sp.AAC.1